VKSPPTLSKKRIKSGIPSHKQTPSIQSKPIHVSNDEIKWLNEEQKKIKTLFADSESKTAFLRPSLTPHLYISPDPKNDVNNSNLSKNDDSLKSKVLNRVIAQFKVDCEKIVSATK
jgi:hypothetical protein